MGQGWLPGRITGLYREDYVNNSSSPAFAKYSDVQREVMNSLGQISPGKGDSWLMRVRHFFLGAS
jgi:hypothetical protein